MTVQRFNDARELVTWLFLFYIALNSDNAVITVIVVALGISGFGRFIFRRLKRIPASADTELMDVVVIAVFAVTAWLHFSSEHDVFCRNPARTLPGPRHLGPHPQSTRDLAE